MRDSGREIARADMPSRNRWGAATVPKSERFIRKGGSLPDVHLLLPALLLMLGACKPPPHEDHAMPQASAARGKALIARAGCGACHAIPGIGWPQGKAGPSLAGFASQGLIAGRLPNRPDMLAAFVRNAPETLPGSTMPAMPLSPAEARDVAAYLYATDGQ